MSNSQFKTYFFLNFVGGLFLGIALSVNIGAVEKSPIDLPGFTGPLLIVAYIARVVYQSC